MSSLKLDDSNSSTDLWYCEGTEKWHWRIVWDAPEGKHMHNGIAYSEDHAKADIARTLSWIEEKWPTQEYFQGV